MNKKELKHAESMDMKKFLKRYFEVENEELLFKLSRLSHKELKEVAPLYGIDLRKISFENLTREMIASGDVILVTDKFGNFAPYINPMIILEDEFSTTLDESFISQNRRREENDKYKRR